MISKLKPRNHSSQSMYHLGYLRDIPNTQSEEGTDIPSPVCLFSSGRGRKKHCSFPAFVLQLSTDVSHVRTGMLVPRQNFAVKNLVFCSKGFSVTFTYVTWASGWSQCSNALSVMKTAKNSLQMHYQSHTYQILFNYLAIWNSSATSMVSWILILNSKIWTTYRDNKVPWVENPWRSYIFSLEKIWRQTSVFWNIHLTVKAPLFTKTLVLLKFLNWLICIMLSSF